jgi:hypothetical protein
MVQSSFANTLDVAARWRPLTSAEESVAEALLVDASLVIRARFPGIDGQIDSGQVDSNAVVSVVAGMVKRAMIAPADGVTQQSEGTGPFSHSQTYANPLGNVFLTAADVTLIMGYQPTGQSHGFANDTTRSTGGYARIYGW